MPAPAPSLSAIPSGAPITAKVTCWFGRRPKRHGGQGLVAIVCIGETQHQRDGGKTLDICGGQLTGSLPDGATAGNLVVAYEPVWAIGTGLTPTTGDVEQVHRFIRDSLVTRFKGEGARIRVLYGGSVKPSNARELMAVANVNGALVGGASLKASDFLAIAAGCP
jgi:triosephosphate isomerase (TIM)